MRQEQYLVVAAPEDARRRWEAALDLEPLPARRYRLTEALGRVLARTVRAPGDVPAFDRSNLDGFAVDAADTFRASEAAPARLPLDGPPIAAGAGRPAPLAPGHARGIATGAPLPRGATAVVAVEDTDLVGDVVEIRRAAPPGAGFSHAGSDVALGEVLVRVGQRLTARETGTLAACGVAEVECVPPARVALLSTGDEIVPPGRPLRLGEVHDANATLLGDAVRELGGEPLWLGVVGDDEAALARALERARAEADLTLLSGGTSKGAGDLCYRALARVAEIRVHGVALKPGKPLCLAAWDRKPVAVLPGFPTSAIFTFHAFVAPVLRRLMGLTPEEPTRVRARVTDAQASEAGRREFCLVTLAEAPDGLLAYPLGKGSGSVTTFARADGFFAIGEAVEQVQAGEEVDVTLLGRALEPADLVVIGSHCTGLDVVLAHTPLARGAKVLAVGSLAGVRAAARGACDLAPIHLLDAPSGRWNAAFAPPGTRLEPGYGRVQGLAWRPEVGEAFADAAPSAGAGTAPDDPGAATQAILERALGDRRLRLANRNPAAGTRLLLERALGGRTPPPGWETAYRSHTAVAAAIAQGRADYGVCLLPVARAHGLPARPWVEERYDFLVPEARAARPAVRAFFAALAAPEVRAALRAEGYAP